MVSPVMAKLKTQCFSFWYLKTGGGIQLKLNKLFYESKTTQTLWTNPLSDPQDEWVKVSVTLVITEQINIIFEAVKKIGITSNTIIFYVLKLKCSFVT